ncbi:uncharacterized protein LOC131172230 [Hevea brasiliensis]|uniref:uncharacterized protein LOC131172230 n=1 Tax=Hevea brasiliensis TaxID=3981 RepID=UPI0025D1255B|nr:uncharacterized protein LOC131172230 [Hevea brasiliensis]
MILKERNKVVFYHISPNPINVACKITNIVEELLLLRETIPKPTHCDHVPVNSGWEAPPLVFLKLNYDVAWKENCMEAVAAVIVRNHKGDLLDGKASHICASSPLAGEARAMLEALKLVTTVEAKFIVLKTDKAELFHAIQAQSGVIPWEIRASVLAIKDYMAAFDDVCIMLVKRTTNKATNFVAKNILSGSLDYSWIRVIPQNLWSILFSDAQLSS